MYSIVTYICIIEQADEAPTEFVKRVAAFKPAKGKPLPSTKHGPGQVVNAYMKCVGSDMAHQVSAAMPSSTPVPAETVRLYFTRYNSNEKRYCCPNPSAIAIMYEKVSRYEKFLSCSSKVSFGQDGIANVLQAKLDFMRNISDDLQDVLDPEVDVFGDIDDEAFASYQDHIASKTVKSPNPRGGMLLLPMPIVVPPLL
eukprot:g5154.t1